MGSHLEGLLERLEGELDLARARHRTIVDRVLTVERDLDLKGAERAVTQLEAQTIDLREAIAMIEDGRGVRAQTIAFPSPPPTRRGERTNKVLGAVEFLNKLGRGATVTDVVGHTKYTEANVRKCLDAEVSRGRLIKRLDDNHTGPGRRKLLFFIPAATVVDIREHDATHTHTIQDTPSAEEPSGDSGGGYLSATNPASDSFLTCNRA